MDGVSHAEEKRRPSQRRRQERCRSHRGLSRRTDPTVNPLAADFYTRLTPTVPEDAGSGLSRELGFGDISSTGQQLIDPNRANVNTYYPADVVSPALYDALQKHPDETQQRMRDFLQRKYGS